MIGVEIEEKIYDAIQRHCVTEEDKEEAKTYFNNILINDLIDEALAEF